MKVAWPGWEAVQLIGRGSFGSVYEIQRTVFNNTESSALKVISIPQNGNDIEEMYNDGYDAETITSTIQNHLQNIVSEYSMMKKMNDCVNIVNCEDLKYEAKEKGIGFNVYIKMELLTPLVKSLPEIITDDIVIKLAKDMCNALNVCKEYGVIHRDIKPQNIFVSKYGDYKLGDFGIAKTVEKTMGGTKIGTYKYMAPEVYNNQPYGSSADIYSLGLVLYWMLNERRMPFMPLPPEKPRVGMEEESRHRRFSGEALPQPLNGSAELKRIVLKACAYNCADRYKDASEMLNDLMNLTGYSNGSAGFATAPVVSGVFSEYDEGTILSETINSYGEDVGLQYSVNPPVMENDYLGDDDGTALLSEETSVLENAEMQYIAMPQVQEDIPAMITPPIQQVQPVVQNVASVSPKKEKSDSSKIIKIIAAVVVVLIGIVSVVVALKVGNKDNATKETDGKNTAQTNAEQQPSANGETTLPPNDVASKTQIEWSVWYDKLPDFVNADEYEIEEKIQYSIRNKEIMSSTKTNSIDGWTLIKTVEAGGLGEWSEWAETPVSEASGREIESQQLYRYRNLENTTSVSNNLPGWTLKNTTTAWSNYGAWSSWSTTPATASDSVKVESKTQYRKRDIIYYSEWSEWSEWSEPKSRNPVFSVVGQKSDTTQIEHKEVSYYYYYLCPSCGKHLHASGTGACNKAYGGCGANIPDSAVNKMCCDLVESQAWYDTGEKYATINGVIWFQGEPGLSFDEKYGWVKERTRTRERYSTPQYGAWTNWGDTVYEEEMILIGGGGSALGTAVPALEIETRTAYRYCTRSQITTYHFERWSDWSNWSIESVSVSSGKEVDTITQYRYRDEVKATTHYFYRWSAWGPYLDGEIQGSDTVEVRTKKQYRYKSKQS